MGRFKAYLIFISFIPRYLRLCRKNSRSEYCERKLSICATYFLAQTLEYIDKLPQETFDEIIDKYSDMNVAHPFREGNGRATRIWLDLILKNKLHKIVDWNQIDKDEYLNAMIRSTVSTNELKYLIQKALTDDLGKEQFFKGIDASYYYEGYYEIKTEDL